MKKFLISTALVLASLGATAQTIISADMLGGNLAVFITNNATVNYNDGGIGMTNANGAAVFSNTNTYSTNGLGVVTLGTEPTNSFAWYGPAWIDMPIWSDRNGAVAPLSLAVSFVGANTKSTNAVTFTFQKLIGIVKTNTPNMPNIPINPSVVALDNATIAINGNGTTAVTIGTNLPTAWLTGATGVRLKSIVTADNGGASGFFIQQVSVNGPKP